VKRFKNSFPKRETAVTLSKKRSIFVVENRGRGSSTGRKGKRKRERWRVAPEQAKQFVPLSAESKGKERKKEEVGWKIWG